MELILDYEIQGSVLYPLYGLIRFLGFENWLGWWFGVKVNRKYAAYLRRGSVMKDIVAERGPYGGLPEP